MSPFCFCMIVKKQFSIASALLFVMVLAGMFAILAQKRSCQAEVQNARRIIRMEMASLLWHERIDQASLLLEHTGITAMPRGGHLPVQNEQFGYIRFSETWDFIDLDLNTNGDMNQVPSPKSQKPQMGT